MIFIDLETFNPVHDVREVGAHKYAENAEILICCFAIDDGPVHRIDWTPEVIRCNAYDLLSELWAFHRKAAHYAGFERAVLNRHGFKSAPDDWDDTAVLALTAGLPAKMSTACALLGYEADEAKDKRGARLIQRFCKPAPSNHKADRYTRETHPDEWGEFIEYCAQDVEVCRRLWRDLPAWVYAKERENWLLDQRINDRGLPIDTAFASAAVNTINAIRCELDAELSKLTGGAVPVATEVLALRDWVMARGVRTDSVDKAAVERLLADEDLPADVRRALQIRQQAGRASVAKYVSAAHNSTDGRLYDSTQFYGANRTGRQAGRQLQPQNMARPKLKGREVEQARAALAKGTVDVLFADPIEAAASCVRTVIAAKPGKKIVAADLSNIEGRKLAWVAGEQWKLDAFRAYDEGTGPDLYKLAYARAFDLSVERIVDEERQVGKVMELALGYQGSIGAFNQMAKAYGVNLPDETVFDLVARWRDAHPATRGLWYAVEDAAIRAVSNPGKTFAVRMLRFQCVEYGRWRWLLVRLPSGRLLCYFAPQLVEVESRGAIKLQLRYTGQVIGGHWSEIATYGGKLVENIIQASARDVLMHGMHAAEAEGYDIVLTVHDEIVCEVDDRPEYNPQDLSALMAAGPAWCEGLPLAAAGFESRYYKKG